MDARDVDHAELDADAYVGARLGGRYRLQKILGRGGMGVVYEAVQEDLGRRVAVKLIAGRVSADALARFRNEAEATARLGNPHIVQVTDFRDAPGEPPFLVMELLSGRSLRSLLEAEGVVGWERAARFGCQILEALAAAHAAGIIHRDIKPDNVLILSSVAVPDMIKVLDFGIAKLEAETAHHMTAPGSVMGTLAYLAPERLRGEQAEARSDLYAVAVTLYEAVAGRRPIEASTAPELVAAITGAEPIPLRTVCPHVPDVFAAVVARGLQKSPAARWASAREMADALARCLGRHDEPPAPTAIGGYVGTTTETVGPTAAITATLTRTPSTEVLSGPATPLDPSQAARASAPAMSPMVMPGQVPVYGIALPSRASGVVPSRPVPRDQPWPAKLAILVAVLVLVGVAGVVLLVVGVIALGTYAQNQVDDRRKTLVADLGSKPSAPTLALDTACKLAELELLRTGFGGEASTAIGDFKCIGPIAQTKDRAQLDAVSFDNGGDQQTVHACFTKGVTWTVTELRKDACPPPPK